VYLREYSVQSQLAGTSIEDSPLTLDLLNSAKPEGIAIEVARFSTSCT
jgi:hypothetical protein